MTKEEFGEVAKEIADEVVKRTLYCSKLILTTEEAAAYLGLSKSYLYKMMMEQRVPYYKPMGKMCYFDRRELEEWLHSNRSATEAEISQRAQSYCIKKGGAI